MNLFAFLQPDKCANVASMESRPANFVALAKHLADRAVSKITVNLRSTVMLMMFVPISGQFRLARAR